MTTIRLFLPTTVINHWYPYQLDIKNIFLPDGLEEEVHIEQSPWFVTYRKFDLVCKLYHSHYSLKQSPYAWIEKFSHIIQTFEMKHSETQ